MAHPKIREITPTGFQRSRDGIEKLIPWIKRDLQAILDDEDVEILCNYIVGLLQTHHVQSDAFLTPLSQFLHAKTDHFVHELIAFANSPLNMDAYDAHVQY